MRTLIKAIEYHLPEAILGNEELAAISAQWSPEKIAQKTGIHERHISEESQFSSDLAVIAAEKLFDSGACTRDDVDFLLLCTQSPDYLLPTTACIVQNRLKLPTSTGAMDFNLGCSGYIYGLGLAHGLLTSGQAKSILLITAETYTKFIRHEDLNVRTLFGDAAAATLIQAVPGEEGKPGIGPFIYGTDGRGAHNLIVTGSAMRPTAMSGESPAGVLHMNGPEIFTFTLRAVPKLVRGLLEKAGLEMDDVDLFVFHQANEYMLEHLRSKIEIPADRFYVSMHDCGNTVSSTIPIALKRAEADGKLKPGHRIMLVGFGVGYSWGATLLDW